MYKIIGADGKEYGPITADDVRRWIAERRLNSQSLVQVAGDTGWKPLSFFPEFSTDVAGAPPAVATASPAANNMAVASLVTGIVSIACCSGCGIFSILGVIFGCVALSQIKHNPSEGGKTLAIAGIVLSAIGLVLPVISMSVGSVGHALRRGHW